MNFNVDSEVGQLRQAIVHRPGLELSRLTPANIGDLLFDDVMWAKRAKEEHDAFAEALRDKGVPCTTSASCWPRRSTCPTAGPSSWTGCARRRSSVRIAGRPVRQLFEDLDGAEAGRVPGRRRPQGGPAPGPERTA